MSDASIVKYGFIGTIAVIALAVLWSCFYTIDSGERGIVLRFGEVTEVVDSGLHFKTPFVESIKVVDVRTRKAEAPAGAGTKDLQTVQTNVTVNYHLDGDLLMDTYTRVGLAVEQKVIDPRIQEVVKAVAARFSAEQLLTKRETVKQDIVSALRTSLNEYNIVLEDVQITNFAFSRSFDAAIEAKQTAEQNALKAKNDLDRIRIEAEQRVALAQAEAEAIRIQANAIRAQGGAEYVNLKAIEKWDGKLPYMNGGNMPFVSVPMK